MNISAKDLAKALKKKGFKKVGGTKHDQYYFFYNGLQTSIRVTISRGSTHTYNENLLAYVLKEMYLLKRQFEDFVGCSLSKEMYIEHLKENEKLSEED